MKVLHLISGNLGGGAAKGAHLLHEGLLNQNIDSKILTNSKTTFSDDSNETINKSKTQDFLVRLRDKVDSLPSFFYPNREPRIFSTSLIGYDFRKHGLYDWADILHLHWINAGFVNIRHLSKVTKPIVWTIRDMWPFTGGCHYTLECENYKNGCGNCLQLHSNWQYDLSWLVNKRKEKFLPENVKFIGISNWISERANESSLLQNYDITTIPNNISTKEFFSLDKKFAKNALGINTDKKIILAGAQNLEDFYKGFDKYLKTIELLDTEKHYLIFFGNLDENIIKNLGYGYKSFGYIHDIISLRMIYSAADVFVAPSLMDAFCKTIAESMACGTPAVCFDAAGPMDIVDHKINGYKAKPYSPEDLAKGIKWILNNNNYNDLCRRAVNKISENYEVSVITQKYISLYEKLLNRCYKKNNLIA